MVVGNAKTVCGGLKASDSYVEARKMFMPKKT